MIDLPNDILAVILHLGGSEVAYDRGPRVGPNPWNLGPPDGFIDIANDLLGVIHQFNHKCSA